MIPVLDDAPETARAPLPKAPVLVTAATRWEAAPLAKALGLAPAGETRWDGTVAGRRTTLLKTGMGAIKTERALSGAAAADYGLVLSAGLCGAMQPGIAAGDVVADVAGVELDYVVPLRRTAKALGVPFHFGRLLHTNVVLGPALKAKLGAEHRALACDMETAAVRRWAGHGAPAFGVRAVLDEVGDELPADAPEGEDAGAMARYALRHAARLPSLVATGLRSGRAMRRLSALLKAYLEAL